MLLNLIDRIERTVVEVEVVSNGTTRNLIDRIESIERATVAETHVSLKSLTSPGI